MSAGCRACLDREPPREAVFVRFRGRRVLAFYSSDEKDHHYTRTMRDTDAAPKRRGFAALDADKRRAISAMGGRAAHAAGTAHRFTSDEAQAAGRKGGSAPHVRRGPRRADA